MTRQEAEEALGFGEGWLRNRARGYGFDIGVLKAWLNLLGISTQDFFQAVEAPDYKSNAEVDEIAEQILRQATIVWEQCDDNES
jgi:hypothetical protein